MPLELRIEKDGRVRHFWYGRFKIKGKRLCLNLGVKVAGTPPASLSLKDEGDTAFERSRAAAQAKLEQISQEAQSRRDSVKLVERLYEIKTGEQIQTIRVADLPDEWGRIPRKRKPTALYAFQCRSTLKRFALFVRQQNPQAEELTQVTRPLARSFMEAEAARGITAQTWNNILYLLRSTFTNLLPAGAINPFSGIPAREAETVFRKPFNPDELKAIVDAARGNDFIRPVIITGICTAMRRGDCCLLKGKDVDLRRRFITVKTSKTGQTVSIPIFPMLYDELSRWPASDGFIFPKQAEMYRTSAISITKRVQKVFAVAGFKDPETSVNGQEEQVRGPIHMERAFGLRRASIRDFHSFRVTWVTLALSAGVPLELVQKVTGHKTTEIVLKHYFQPGQEEFRRALQSAMPRLLTNGQSKTPLEQVAAIAAKSTTKTAWRDIKAIRAVLAD